MNIQSQKKEISRSMEEIFSFLSDFNNFEKLMPEEIANWSSTTDTCRFEIRNMATIELRIVEKRAPEYLCINSEGKSPFSFELKTFLSALNDNNSTVYFEIDADVNPMMSMMVKRPLENLVEVMTDKLKEHLEQA